MPADRPNPARPATPANPRKVRGGIRLARSAAAYPESWAASRWLRLVQQSADAAVIDEGVQYARLGQTRHLTVEPGGVRATVQGRAPRAYEVTIAVATLAHEQWEGVVATAVDQPVYAARLLAGEFPVALEDALTRRGTPMLPPDAAALRPRCSCADAERRPGGWCKHACCAAVLAAERIAEDAFLVFAMRGMSRDDVLERVRQRRALAGAGAAGVPVYVPHVPGVADELAPPLDTLADRYWDAPRPDTGERPAPELALRPPEVSHPLLRRLGPSPFAAPDGTGRAAASFPIVGLLATCYDLVSEAVIHRDDSEPGAGEESAAEDAAGSGPDPAGRPQSAGG